MHYGHGSLVGCLVQLCWLSLLNININNNIIIIVIVVTVVVVVIVIITVVVADVVVVAVLFFLLLFLSLLFVRSKCITLGRHSIQTGVFLVLGFIGNLSETFKSKVRDLDHPATVQQTVGALQTTVKLQLTFVNVFHSLTSTQRLKSDSR